MFAETKADLSIIQTNLGDIKSATAKAKEAFINFNQHIEQLRNMAGALQQSAKLT